LLICARSARSGARAMPLRQRAAKISAAQRRNVEMRAEAAAAGVRAARVMRVTPCGAMPRATPRFIHPDNDHAARAAPPDYLAPMLADTVFHADLLMFLRCPVTLPPFDCFIRRYRCYDAVD